MGNRILYQIYTPATPATVYSHTTGSLPNTATDINQTAIDNTLVGIADTVKSACGSVVPQDDTVSLAVCRYLTCKALTLSTITTITNVDVWYRMYDLLIKPALQNVTCIASFVKWQASCLEALKTMLNSPVSNSIVQSLVLPTGIKTDQFAEIVLNLHGVWLQDRYSQEIQDRNQDFYVGRCHILSKYLMIIYLFDFCYNNASTQIKPTISGDFLDPLNLVATFLTKYTQRNDVTVEVKTLGDITHASIETVKYDSNTLQKDQMQLETTLSKERLAKDEMRKAITSFSVWLVVLVVITTWTLTELTMRRYRSTIYIGSLTIIGLSIFWIVRAFSQGKDQNYNFIYQTNTNY